MYTRAREKYPTFCETCVYPIYSILVYMAKNKEKTSPAHNGYCIVRAATIKSLLAQRALTAAEMARAIGISPQLLSHLLTGRRRADPYLRDIARFLRVPVETLFYTRIVPPRRRRLP